MSRAYTSNGTAPKTQQLSRPKWSLVDTFLRLHKDFDESAQRPLELSELQMTGMLLLVFRIILD